MKEPDDRSRRRFLKASSILGLAAAFSPATIGEAFADSAPKSPPCATNSSCPRRFIGTTQALAVRSGPQPEVVSLAENPNPGSDGITRWKASDALPPCAVGVVSGSIIWPACRRACLGRANRKAIRRRIRVSFPNPSQAASVQFTEERIL
jgi:hypothetical protein